MQSKDFIVSTERSLGLIKARCRGFWSMETARDFSNEVTKAILSLERAQNGRPVKLLIDARESVTQSVEVADVLSGLSANLSASIVKTAVVTPSAIHRLQAQRINERPNHRPFDSEEVALAWLLG